MTTINDTDRLVCPNCDHEDDFVVTATCNVRLTEGSVAFKYADRYSWDDRAAIQCCNCGRTDTVRGFTVPERRFRVTRTETIDYAATLTETEVREWFGDVLQIDVDTERLAAQVEAECTSPSPRTDTFVDFLERFGDVRGSTWKVEEL